MPLKEKLGSSRMETELPGGAEDGTHGSEEGEPAATLPFAQRKS